METLTEESGRHCALCLIFVSTANVKLCNGCKRRAYCSDECEHEDWSGDKGQAHKHWCNLGCGEEDLDWEVVPVPGKGLGVVAKRMIPEKFQIMVDAIRSKTHPGVQDLMPMNGTLAEKVDLNCIENGFGGTILCLRISRANHNCYSNADHYYDHTFNVEILYAQRDIQKGEEICINYQPIDDITSSREQVLPSSARLTLSTHWGIDCNEECYCRNHEIHRVVNKGRELDADILQYALDGRCEEGLKAVDDTLELLASIKASYITKMRILYEGFQIANMKNGNPQKAEEYMRQVYEIASRVIGSPNSEIALSYKCYLLDPSKHPSYLANSWNLCF